MKNIAIVGGGLAGSSALKELLNHPNLDEKDRITIFVSEHRVGAGMPYDSDSHTIMLNIPPDILSVEESEPDDFINWINQNYETQTNFEELVPRPLYGEYLNERFQPYYDHKQVKVIQTSVEDLQVLNQKGKEAKDGDPGPYFYDLYTEQAGWLNEAFDTVFFAIGHLPYSDYYDLLGEKNYIHNPYPAKETLSFFNGNEKIGIIGSGAAGIDIMRYLVQEKRLKRPLTFYVRDEAFYTPYIPLEKEFMNFSLSDDWIVKELKKGNGLIPLEHIHDLVVNDFATEGVDPFKVYSDYKEGKLEQYRGALKTCDQDLAYTQKYTSSMVPYLPSLLNALNQKDLELFIEKYRDPLEFLRTVTPTKTFEWILDLLETDQIRVVRDLEEIVPLENKGFKIRAEEKETVGYLINATGFEMQLKEAKELNPLIENLYEKRLILSGFRGEGILVTWPGLEVMNQRYGLLKNVFFFGSFISSTHHPNNDAGNIMRKSQATIQWYMEKKD